MSSEVLLEQVHVNGMFDLECSLCGFISRYFSLNQVNPKYLKRRVIKVYEGKIPTILIKGDK